MKEGKFLTWSAVLPAFALLGFGLLLLPIDTQELKAKYGTERIERWEQAPLAWKVLLVLMIVVAVGNWLLLKYL